MRAVSEIISLVLLIAATSVAFLMTIVVVPRFFAAYNAVAVGASYSQMLEGYQTSASLSRVDQSGQSYLTVIIYYGGDSSTSVNYYVECVKSGSQERYFVGKEENVYIDTVNRLYTRVYKVSSSAISGYVCYLTIEEPHLLVYRVVES